MRSFVAFLRTFILIFLIVLVAMNLWMLGNKFIMGEDIPKIMGYSNAIVLTGSMEPSISAGDMLIFKTEKEYGEGDIIVFKSDNMLVTHRIIEKTPGGFITKGDANNTEDEALVSQSQVVGKLKWVIPFFGFVVNFFKGPLGMLILIVIGLALIELSDYKGKRRKPSKEKKDVGEKT